MFRSLTFFRYVLTKGKIQLHLLTWTLIQISKATVICIYVQVRRRSSLWATRLPLMKCLMRGNRSLWTLPFVFKMYFFHLWAYLKKVSDQNIFIEQVKTVCGCSLFSILVRVYSTNTISTTWMLDCLKSSPVFPYTCSDFVQPWVTTGQRFLKFSHALLKREFHRIHSQLCLVSLTFPFCLHLRNTL